MVLLLRRLMVKITGCSYAIFTSCLVIVGCGGLAADLAPSNAPDVVVNSLPAVADPFNLQWYIWVIIGFVAGYYVRHKKII